MWQDNISRYVIHSFTVYLPSKIRLKCTIYETNYRNETNFVLPEKSSAEIARALSRRCLVINVEWTLICGAATDQFLHE